MQSHITYMIFLDPLQLEVTSECEEHFCLKNFVHSFDGKGREITSQLTISNMTNEDAGEYQCIVANKFGVTYSERANITVYVYPEFVVTPEDITVQGNQIFKHNVCHNVEYKNLLFYYRWIHCSFEMCSKRCS